MMVSVVHKFVVGACNCLLPVGSTRIPAALHWLDSADHGALDRKQATDEDSQGVLSQVLIVHSTKRERRSDLNTAVY